MPLDKLKKFIEEALPKPKPKKARASASSGSSSIASLLSEHEAAVKALREALQASEPSLFSPRKHDDLWLLRFVLSHNGNVAKASEKARFTLRWRAQHNLDKVAETVRTTPQSEWPSAPKISPVFPMRLYQPDDGRGPFLLLCATDLDPDKLAKAGISKDDDFAFALHMTEWMQQSCEAVTRKTGTLTKVCRLIDVKAASGKHIQAVFFGPIGPAASSQPIEDAYPQLVGALMILNLPPAGRWMWDHTVKPLLPERVASKSFVIDPASAADRATVATYIAMEHLPTQYGGTCEASPLPDATATRRW